MIPDEEISLLYNNKLNKIIFNVEYYGIKNKITIDRNKLDKWRNISEYIDTILNCQHDNEILELNLNEMLDLYSLVNIFNFFDTKKLLNIDLEYKSKILNGLAYFGVKSDMLNSIKKGFGLVWKLCDIDIDINNNEKKIKNKISENKDNENELKNIDNDFLLNENTYNKLYEKLYENYPLILKSYDHLSIFQYIISPEFDLTFIKQEFEKNSKFIFNLSDCLVTGGMVTKHFTYNGYFEKTSYDIYIINYSDTSSFVSQKKALDTIKFLYNKLNFLFKTYIIKTKENIILYNNNYEFKIKTKIYNSIVDVFTNIDLDCCCVGYCNGKLYGLPRFIRSLAYSGNVFDPEKQNPNYIYNLKKYINRGFTFYAPGIKKNDTDYNKNNYIVRKLREKNNECFDLILMKNQNIDISSFLEKYHKKNKFNDIFLIKNIDDIYTTDIDWNFNYLENFKKIDLYHDMYNSIYVN